MSRIVVVPDVTDERLVQLFKQFQGSARQVALATGLHRRTVERRRARLAHKGFAPKQGLKELYPDGFNLGKVTIHRDSTGEIKNTWERMCPDDLRKEEMLRIAMLAMVQKLPRCLPRKNLIQHADMDMLTVYPIGDPHVGMYAWDEECGDNWDLKLAEQIHCDAMQRVVHMTLPSHTAIVLNLGDLLHYDSLATVTPRSGHHLDGDGRYAKMIHIAVKTMRRCIESALEKHQHVHVISLPGNHDETGALWTALALSIAYENEPRVTVDVNPSVFSYYRFHNVLIGAHHGHSCKPIALPGVMATDRAKDWGETEWRYWLMGHIHHESKKEFPGVVVESFNTLAAKDSHATNGGWRSNRTLTGISYHREDGEIARAKVNAKMVTKK